MTDRLPRRQHSSAASEMMATPTAAAGAPSLAVSPRSQSGAATYEAQTPTHCSFANAHRPHNGRDRSASPSRDPLHAHKRQRTDPPLVACEAVKGLLRPSDGALGIDRTPSWVRQALSTAPELASGKGKAIPCSSEPIAENSSPIAANVTGAAQLDDIVPSDASNDISAEVANMIPGSQAKLQYPAPQHAVSQDGGEASMGTADGNGVLPLSTAADYVVSCGNGTYYHTGVTVCHPYIQGTPVPAAVQSSCPPSSAPAGTPAAAPITPASVAALLSAAGAGPAPLHTASTLTPLLSRANIVVNEVLGIYRNDRQWNPIAHVRILLAGWHMMLQIQRHLAVAGEPRSLPYFVAERIVRARLLEHPLQSPLHHLPHGARSVRWVRPTQHPDLEIFIEHATALLVKWLRCARLAMRVLNEEQRVDEALHHAIIEAVHWGTQLLPMARTWTGPLGPHQFADGQDIWEDLYVVLQMELSVSYMRAQLWNGQGLAKFLICTEWTVCVGWADEAIRHMRSPEAIFDYVNEISDYILTACKGQPKDILDSMLWLALSWLHHAWYSMQSAAQRSVKFLSQWSNHLLVMSRRLDNLELAAAAVEALHMAHLLEPEDADLTLRLAKVERSAARVATRDGDGDRAAHWLQSAAAQYRHVLRLHPTRHAAFRALENMKVATDADVARYNAAVDAATWRAHRGRSESGTERSPQALHVMSGSKFGRDQYHFETQEHTHAFDGWDEPDDNREMEWFEGDGDDVPADSDEVDHAKSKAKDWMRKSEHANHSGSQSLSEPASTAEGDMSDLEEDGDDDLASLASSSQSFSVTGSPGSRRHVDAENCAPPRPPPPITSPTAGKTTVGQQPQAYLAGPKMRRLRMATGGRFSGQGGEGSGSDTASEVNTSDARAATDLQPQLQNTARRTQRDRGAMLALLAGYTSDPEEAAAAEQLSSIVQRPRQRHATCTLDKADEDDDEESDDVEYDPDRESDNDDDDDDDDEDEDVRVDEMSQCSHDERVSSAPASAASSPSRDAKCGRGSAISGTSAFASGSSAHPSRKRRWDSPSASDIDGSGDDDEESLEDPEAELADLLGDMDTPPGYPGDHSAK